jgi:hypothetical protein
LPEEETRLGHRRKRKAISLVRALAISTRRTTRLLPRSGLCRLGLLRRLARRLSPSHLSAPHRAPAAPHTFSSSSFLAASSAACFFAASSCALSTGAAAPGRARFFASRAAFSSSLIRRIRGSCASARSTSARSRAVFSFSRRARSVLFFFSVYRLSSRLPGVY